ncbi:TonB-dependent receptor family protein [Entomobacter blattae]|uniref:Fe(3+) dicitrate transport protein FecA n=1 Tax=Entomobacter blattae TaxID=2762277 RepID=A0A7H1NTY3_9PROT|nr:TonB-dependent siderophore receptor [Entomobacter blattae]QNT79243.1 Fe(3+) dicitrate transport protein FecA [Entomobacter blattae]
MKHYSLFSSSALQTTVAWASIVFIGSIFPLNVVFSQELKPNSPAGNKPKTPPKKQDKPQDKPADEQIVIQGDILGENSKKALRYYAGSRSVISSDTLRNGGIRSLDDALQHVPSVKIFDETGTGALPQIMVRGLYESRSGRVQLLQDGIPLSLAPYGQTSVSLFPVTLDMIDRIDIVRGGAAVQYGPNNVGGVINLVSRPIPKKWETTFGDRLQVAQNGNVIFNNFVSTGGHVTDDFALQLDTNFQNGDTFRNGHNKVDTKNFRLRGQYDIDDDTRIRAEIQHYTLNIDLPGSLTPNDYKQDPYQTTRPLDNVVGHTVRGNLVVQHDFGELGPFEGGQFTWTGFASTTYRNYKVGMRTNANETWLSNLPPELLQQAPRDYQVFGAQPQLTLRAHSGDVSHEITMGARATFEDIGFIVNRTQLQTNVVSLIQNRHFTDKAWATFISDKIGLLDETLTLTPGFRFEHLDSSFYDRMNGQKTGNGIRNILPGVTASYKIGKTGMVFFDAQRSLRAPQVTQIIYGNNLNSELAWNYETGGRYFPDKNTTLGLTFYRIDFNNQITLDNTSRTYVNLGSTRNQGIELSAEWQLPAVPDLSFKATYAFLDAKQLNGQYSGKRTPYTSKHQITGDIRYKLDRSTEFDINGYYFSNAYSDAANTRQENAIASVGRLPSYVVFNAQASHVFYEQNNGATVRGSFSILNFANEHYYFRGIDTSPWGRETAPGRTFIMGVQATL